MQLPPKRLLRAGERCRPDGPFAACLRAKRQVVVMSSLPSVTSDSFTVKVCEIPATETS